MVLLKAIFKLFGEEKGAIWGLADSFELINTLGGWACPQLGMPIFTRFLIDLDVSYTQIVGVQTAY